MKRKAKKPKLMKGFLWWVEENEDGTIPDLLKEFKQNIFDDTKPEKLSLGNIIPKNKNTEKQLIFNCYREEENETTSFRLFLYDDNKTSGIISYKKDDLNNLKETKHYFKGSYKLNLNSKIVVWGIWSDDSTFKKKWITYIELYKKN